jgi:benzoyl-CoA reductase subunit BamB
MRYAETGFDLEIDLSRGSIERVESDPKLTQLHLGGLGTNAKILWDRVPAEAEAFDEDNLLIFGAGLLCGTAAPGCNRTIVSTFSPQTRLMAYSMMGGFWAPELKYAGYDRVILRGKSPELVYLWIHNDKVEIRDASHLRGKGAIETAECIRRELKQPEAQVAAIGLAGENRVFYASIEQGRSSASRGGIGAVMGDKGVKAIAVRGTKDINIARPAEFMALCDQIWKYIKFREDHPIQNVIPIIAGLGSPQEMKLFDEKWHTTNFMWGNSRTRRKDFWNEEVEKSWKQTQESVRTRLISCYNC